MNTSVRKKRILLVVAIAAVVIITGLVLLKNNTTAEITVIPTGHAGTVFIDKKTQGQLPATSSATFQVSPGSREVLVSAENTYPWQETVDAPAGTTTTVSPFLVPRNPQPIRDLPERVTTRLEQIRATDDSTALQSASSSSVRLFVNEDTNLIAQWRGSSSTAPSFYNCHQGTCGVSVFQSSDQPITQVNFYPGRSDVAVFATRTGVFAIEIDPTGETQNFQPITSSRAGPHFVITQDGSIIIQSDNRVTATQLR